jgi:tetratricopeptide (TPR) repeat protein
VVLQEAQALLSSEAFPPASRSPRKEQILEELAVAAAGMGDFDSALRFQRRFVALAEKRQNPPNRWFMLGHAYRGLGQRLVATGELQAAEQAYLRSLQLWQRRVQRDPADIQTLRAVAGIHTELAMLHAKRVEQAQDGEAKQRSRQRACAEFQRGQALLRHLPDPEIGFGSRHLWLPAPSAVEEQFARLCATQGISR